LLDCYGTGGHKMNYKKVYEFLKHLYEEKFNYPCDNCGYWECKKNLLNKKILFVKNTNGMILIGVFV
jgi:hypothetical protein